MNVVLIVLQTLLGLVFLGAGGSKIAGVPTQIQNFDHWHISQRLRPVVGLFEIVGALGMLGSILLPWLAPIAALWLVMIMLGALLTHIRIHDTAQHFVPPFALLCFAALVAVLRWSALMEHFI